MVRQCAFQDSGPKSNPATAESNSDNSMELGRVPSRSRHPLHPSIEKEDRAEPCADQRGANERFEDSLALEEAFDRPHDESNRCNGEPMSGQEIQQRMLIHSGDCTAPIGE